MNKKIYDSLSEKEKVWADLWLETNILLGKLNRAIDIEITDDPQR